MKARYRRKITIRVVSKSGKDESERSVNSPYSPIWQHFGFSLKFSIFFPEASPPGIESERENKRSTMSLVVSFVSNVAILTSRGLALRGDFFRCTADFQRQQRAVLLYIRPHKIYQIGKRIDVESLRSDTRGFLFHLM